MPIGPKIEIKPALRRRIDKLLPLLYAELDRLEIVEVQLRQELSNVKRRIALLESQKVKEAQSVIQLSGPSDPICT